jgi:ATP-dependent DNA ligase
VVFDVLQFSGRDITRQPSAQRRQRLTALAAHSNGAVVQFPSSWMDIDPLDSPYTPGL